jgi:hypothetical protein
MWARSLGHHMYHGGLFSLDNWDTSATYVVIDDIEWKWLPSKKQLLGGQWEFNLTDKYRRKRTVTYGLAAIYCMNEDNYREMTRDPIWEWVEGNCVLHHIDTPLF